MIELPTVIIGIIINLFFVVVLLSRRNLRIILFNQMMIANAFINIATLILTLLYLPMETFSVVCSHSWALVKFSGTAQTFWGVQYFLILHLAEKVLRSVLGPVNAPTSDRALVLS